ncbi:MAG: VWA domain-containing protein [Gammaproteobacteria bacterium]|nr:VWA domain-containing protein [Gammaproteobacteria bacterium]
MIEFEWPWIFLLLPLPFLARRLLPRLKETQQAALRVPFLDDFSDQASTRQSTKQQSIMLLAAFAIWILLLLAAARPQWVGAPIDLPVSGRDLMMAIDLSGSMETKDFVLNNKTIDRLTATKVVASDFIQRRQGDRIGLILFGDRAYVQTPLTFDRKTVTTLLLEAALGLAGQRTAIGDAIGLTVKRLQKNPETQRVLILMTDGASNAGEIEPLTAADLAAKAHLKIYTIGIGADEIFRRSFFGMQRVNPSSDLDEKMLQAIANKTGGRYFRARNTEELEEIYAMLDKLEPVEQDAQSFRPTLALFYWPLGLALLITMVVTAARLGKSA